MAMNRENNLSFSHFDSKLAEHHIISPSLDAFYQTGRALHPELTRN
jgi:hypothetical protein